MRRRGVSWCLWRDIDMAEAGHVQKDTQDSWTQSGLCLWLPHLLRGPAFLGHMVQRARRPSLPGEGHPAHFATGFVVLASAAYGFSPCPASRPPSFDLQPSSPPSPCVPSQSPIIALMVLTDNCHTQLQLLLPPPRTIHPCTSTHSIC